MANKTKTIYECNECGYRSPKWLGKCPGCNNWNSLVETFDSPSVSSNTSTGLSVKSTLNRPKPIKEISHGFESRFSTGMKELDRVLGGGVVNGELILVGGYPGIGK